LYIAAPAQFGSDWLVPRPGSDSRDRILAVVLSGHAQLPLFHSNAGDLRNISIGTPKEVIEGSGANGVRDFEVIEGFGLQLPFLNIGDKDLSINHFNIEVDSLVNHHRARIDYGESVEVHCHAYLGNLINKNGFAKSVLVVFPSSVQVRRVVRRILALAVL